MNTNIIKLLLIIATFMVSCSKNDYTPNGQNSQDGQMSFSAMSYPTTKVTENSAWELNDKVGIFVYENSTAVYSNLQFYISRTTDGALTAVDDGITYKQANPPRNYYAYYPYDASTSGANLNIDLTTEQEPLIYAKVENYSSKNVNFQFNNQLVKLNLTFTASGGEITNLNGATLRIEGAYTKGVFDVKSGAWSSRTVSNLSHSISSSSTSKSTSLYLIGAADPTSTTFIITVDGKQYGWKPTTTSWVAGQQYTYNITVGKTGDPRTTLLDNNINMRGTVHTMTKDASGNYSIVVHAGSGYNHNPGSSGPSTSEVLLSLPEGATISPNPSSVFTTEKKYAKGTFTITNYLGQKGTPFTITYYPDPVYTLVIIGDTEWRVESRPYRTIEESTARANKIVDIKNKRPPFTNHPSIPINPEILMLVGDVSADRDNDYDDFMTVFNNCYNAGIKCLNFYGNHDWDPIDWGDGTYGFNLFNDNSSSVERIQEAAIKSGVSISSIEDRNADLSDWKTPYPFTFVYRGVRYYCGNYHWFIPYYQNGANIGDWWLSDPEFRAADGIISRLEEIVNANTQQPSIWMQHVPVASSWMDRYLTDKDGNAISTAYNTADKRRDKLKELIVKTTNPVHFSGHIHQYYTYTHSSDGKSFKDYVVDDWPEGDNGPGYMVLVSEKEGVLDVQRYNNTSF